MRVVPGFHIDPEEVVALAPPDCPPELLQVTLDALSEEAADRPGFDALAKRLQVLLKTIKATRENTRPVPAGGVSEEEAKAAVGGDSD